jgi:cobalt/nickel transport protein
MMKSKNIITPLLLIAMVIGITIFPLLFNKNAEFGGADGKAEEMITEVQPEYEPWFEPLWEPPSGEIESMLFSLQAAIGAGIIGYGLGYLKGRNKPKDHTDA